jgi:hypothetical protein
VLQLVHNASDQAWCGGLGGSPVVSYSLSRGLGSALEALCRNSDFFLRASQPEPQQPLLTSPSKYGVTELEANAAIVVKGDFDELQRRIHRRDGPVMQRVSDTSSKTARCPVWRAAIRCRRLVARRAWRGASSVPRLVLGASRALLAEVGRVNLCFRGDSELRLGVEGVLLDGPSRAAKAHQLRPFRPSRPTPGRRRSTRPIEVSRQREP